MATIVKTLTTGSGSRAMVETTLTASDTFTYEAGQLLILRNGTGGGLTVTIDGAGGTTVPVAGIGAVSVATGYSTGVIAAGAAVVIPLDTIAAYLQGAIAVTGGTGISASLLGK